MICPNCGHDNLPGSEECSSCLQDLTQLDLPIAQNRVERSLMEDPIAALRPQKPVTIKPSATIREAIDAMLGKDIGALLIVGEDGKLIGILSERDLLTKAAGGPSPSSAKKSELTCWSRCAPRALPRFRLHVPALVKLLPQHRITISERPRRMVIPQAAGVHLDLG